LRENRYVTTTADEARNRLRVNRVRKGRNDVRDEDFENVVQSFEVPDDDEAVIRYDTTQPLAAWLRETFSTDGYMR